MIHNVGPVLAPTKFRVRCSLDDQDFADPEEQNIIFPKELNHSPWRQVGDAGTVAAVEIGYLPIDRAGANLFFQLISRRYERGPMILTSNQSFGSWGDVFGDRVIATAILDRVLHHAITINIRGNSYRLTRVRSMATSSRTSTAAASSCSTTRAWWPSSWASSAEPRGAGAIPSTMRPEGMTTWRMPRVARCCSRRGPRRGSRPSVPAGRPEPGPGRANAPSSP